MRGAGLGKGILVCIGWSIVRLSVDIDFPPLSLLCFDCDSSTAGSNFGNWMDKGTLEI